MFRMQHLRSIYRLKCRAAYCCGRHLSDNLVSTHVSKISDVSETSSEPELVSNRPITPASDLNVKIYQPPFYAEPREIFGGDYNLQPV